MDVPFDLWGQRGRPGFDVVGESYYADAIRDVFGSGFRPGGCELVTTAQLVPEPWNRHDPDAVAVWVGERQVGYLPRHEAARYAPVLSRLVAEGWTPQVGARLWAASDYQGRAGLTGSVRIDLAEPHLIAPVNRAPDRPHRLLPPGGAIQVTGAENHLDTLLPRLAPEGDCWVQVTLHELVEPLPNGSRSALEVRLDGGPAGRLTPRMSAELLPAVRRLAAAGQLTAARALLRSNGPQPELVLYAARAHDLPDSWLPAVLPPVSPPPIGTARVAVSAAAGTLRPAVAPINAGTARPGAFPGRVHGAGAPGSNVTGHWDLLDTRDPAARAHPVPVNGGYAVASAERPGAGPAAPAVRPIPSPFEAEPGLLGAPTEIQHLPGRDPVAEEAGPGAARPAGRIPMPPRAPSPAAPVPNARPARHGPIPPPPAGFRFAVPPGWPQPPAGWAPPTGWRPNPSWPPAPPEWQWWVPYWDQT